MTALLILIPVSLLMAGSALGLFFWALRSGQFDDPDGASQRILLDDDIITPSPRPSPARGAVASFNAPTL